MNTSASIRRCLRMAVPVMLGLSAAAGVGYLYVVPVDRPGAYPSCYFHLLTGWHCPACGTTRCLQSALHFQFLQAMRYHPLALLIVPVILGSIFHSLCSWALDRPAIEKFESDMGRKATWLLGGILLLFSVLRIVPWYPLTLLAPP